MLDIEVNHYPPVQTAELIRYDLTFNFTTLRKCRILVEIKIKIKIIIFEGGFTVNSEFSDRVGEEDCSKTNKSLTKLIQIVSIDTEESMLYSIFDQFLLKSDSEQID